MTDVYRAEPAAAVDRTITVAASLLIALLLTLSAAPALACSCHMGEPPQKLESADRVFLATVARVERLGTANAFGDENIIVHFDAMEPLKGEQIGALHSADNRVGCTGYWFKQGEHYLIYAFQRDDGLFDTMWCGGVIAKAENLVDFDAEVAAVRAMLVDP